MKIHILHTFLLRISGIFQKKMLCFISFQSIFSFLFFAAALEADAQGIGPNKVYYLVHDCRDDWQVFDERYKAYVPYIQERHENYSSFSLFFDIENYKNYKILYRSSKENVLFVDAALQRQLPADAWVVMDIDSLERVYGKTKLFLTFFGNTTNVGDIEVLVGNRIIASNTDIILPESGLTILPKNFSPFQNFLVLATLFLLSSYAFLYNYQSRAFQRFFNIQDLVTVNNRNDSFLVSKPFDVGNLLFTLNLSITLAYLYLLLQHNSAAIFSIQSLIGDNKTLFDFIGNFLKISLIIFGLFMFKYLALSLLTGLYQLKRVTNIHFFKIIQASSIFFLGVAILMLFMTVSTPTNAAILEKIILYVVIIFFVSRLVLLYFTINKLSSLKNLYLISYLCIVEFIPLIVGIRFAMP